MLFWWNQLIDCKQCLNNNFHQFVQINLDTNLSSTVFSKNLLTMIKPSTLWFQFITLNCQLIIPKFSLSNLSYGLPYWFKIIGKKKSAPLGCKKITKMPKLTDTSSKAMLVKTLTERNRCCRIITFGRHLLNHILLPSVLDYSNTYMVFRFFENVHCNVETQEYWKTHAM